MTFDDFIKLRDLINNDSLRIENSIIYSRVRAEESDRGIISEADKEGIANFKQIYSTSKFPVESDVVIKIDTIREVFNIDYYDSLKSFLWINQFKLPSSYYIYEIRFNSLADKKPEIIIQVERYYEILQIFKELADDTSGGLLFVLNHKDRIKLKIDKAAPLVDESEYNEFIRCFRNESLRFYKEFKILVYNRIYNFAKNNQVTNLSFFIEHFGEFFKEITKDYQILISDYSFDKIKKEFDDKKEKYISSLNTHLKEVTKEIVSIPLGIGATFLLKLADNNNYNSYLIFLAFTALYIWLSLQFRVAIIHNELLCHVNSQIKSDEDDYKKKKNHSEELNITGKDEFERGFSFLKKRISRISKVINLIYILLFIFLIMLTIVFSSWIYDSFSCIQRLF